MSCDAGSRKAGLGLALATDTPSTIDPDDPALVGTTGRAADAGHQHAIVTGAPITVDGLVNAEGNGSGFARDNHAHRLQVPVHWLTGDAGTPANYGEQGRRPKIRFKFPSFFFASVLDNPTDDAVDVIFTGNVDEPIIVSSTTAFSTTSTTDVIPSSGGQTALPPGKYLVVATAEFDAAAVTGKANLYFNGAKILASERNVTVARDTIAMMAIVNNTNAAATMECSLRMRSDSGVLNFTVRNRQFFAFRYV